MDPIELELFNNRLSAIAEEMGGVLGRTGFSPNIKERRDYSCALFDAHGRLVAQAAHIPVHLGSTPLSVQAAIEKVRMARGDVVVLNDPYSGGTHLPDVTVVAPVFLPAGKKPFGYVANRAHHADIGGMTPGSMPLATEIFQEGLRLPPVYLACGGKMQKDFLALFLANVRVEEERRGDLFAQWAALRVGIARMVELVKRQGEKTVTRAMAALQDYSASLMEITLRHIPSGHYEAQDFLDDDGCEHRPVAIRVAVTVKGRKARVDFSGSDPQVQGCVNANVAITLSAVFYVFTSLADFPIPPNAGIMRPLEVVVPEGTVVNALFPAAVAGGNVETSQRIVDVLLKALAPALPEKIPAASCGSMNNIAIGGYDPFAGRTFSYYETVAGGAGAGSLGPGASGVHTHMTNTMNTPIEALEAYYPLRVTRYAVRGGSGGKGRHRGGDGLVRELELLTDASVTILSERRKIPPYGLRGGRPGKPGRNVLIRNGKNRLLPSKVNLAVRAGDRIHVETPGGGGWGVS